MTVYLIIEWRDVGADQDAVDVLGVYANRSDARTEAKRLQDIADEAGAEVSYVVFGKDVHQ